MPSIMLYVLCACPLDVGLFVCFCALFSLLNVEGVYNDSSLCLIVILLASNLSCDQCLFGEGLHGPPPCIKGCPVHTTLKQIVKLRQQIEWWRWFYDAHSIALTNQPTELGIYS